jgi:hypothetical protein
VCVEEIFEKQEFFEKSFSAKKNCHKKSFAEKKVRDFFTNFKIKNIFKILENIFLDFSFSKKQ